MLTKDKQNGMIFGVCSGIAKQLDVNPGLVRIATVLGFLMTGSIVGLVYLIAALVLPNE